MFRVWHLPMHNGANTGMCIAPVRCLPKCWNCNVQFSWLTYKGNDTNNGGEENLFDIQLCVCVCGYLSSFCISHSLCSLLLFSFYR